MKSHSGAPHTATRMFAVFVAVALVPVVALGLVLAGSYRAEADRRGLAEATHGSALFATTAIEPLLASHDLRHRVIVTPLRQIRDWGQPAADISVAVNISARNLSNPAFGDAVLAALADSGLPHGRLLLEITETAVFTDIERATAVLDRLSSAGLPISLDDFGQGQTSLGFLSRLPLRELKIDRAFVTDMLVDRTHSAIVRSVVELAHNLGLVVVAEGVEDDATMSAVADMGCDAAQGYVLARPMPADALLGWVRAHGARLELTSLR